MFSPFLSGISLYLLIFRAAYLQELNDNFTQIDSIIDIFYWVNIVFAFFASYYSNGVLVTSNVKIAKRYLSTWFVLDFFSNLPLQLVDGLVWVKLLRFRFFKQSIKGAQLILVTPVLLVQSP